MKKRTQRLIIAIVVFLFAILIQYLYPQLSSFQQPSNDVLGQKNQEAKVIRVIDGDTIEVEQGEERYKIRIIGVNTPETVDPRREVECYGKEASNRAKELLLGKHVRLESDPTQSDRDRYGRLLRYVFFLDETDFGLTMIRDGFAYEYTYDSPYKFQEDYKKAQLEAEANKRGLWGSSCV